MTYHENLILLLDDTYAVSAQKFETFGNFFGGIRTPDQWGGVLVPHIRAGGSEKKTLAFFRLKVEEGQKAYHSIAPPLIRKPLRTFRSSTRSEPGIDKQIII